MERLLKSAGIPIPKGFDFEGAIKEAQQQKFEITKINVKLNFVLRILEKKYPVIFQKMLKEELEVNQPIIEGEK